ncbi:MAG: response regulator transcription factor [Saprospiraceae bacterium]|nr:response regulator transcription factor [Saprospiraceae bacterium]
MKINTLIIDDDSEWQFVLRKLVEMNPLLNLVAVCQSAMEAYAQLANHNIELIVCDIEMSPISGLDFIKNIENPPLTIFVTSHRGYALDCYEVSPIDFLVKPIEPTRFFRSIEKVRKRLTEVPDPVEPYFYIWENKTYNQINYKDVLYIKSDGNFVQIVTSDQVYMPTGTITKLEEKLKVDIFLRVHRSYLVHRSAIAKVTKNEVILRNGQEIPIGDQYRNKIQQKHIEAYRGL